MRPPVVEIIPEELEEVVVENPVIEENSKTPAGGIVSVAVFVQYFVK